MAITKVLTHGNSKYLWVMQFPLPVHNRIKTGEEKGSNKLNPKSSVKWQDFIDYGSPYFLFFYFSWLSAALDSPRIHGIPYMAPCQQ